MTLKSKIWLAIITLYVVWGSTYLGISILVREVQPLFGAGFRNLLAGVLVLIFVIATSKTGSIKKSDIWQPILTGFLMLTLGNGLITVAAQWVPSGYISIFPGLVPLWLLILNFIFDNKKPSIYGLLGCLLGFLGVYFLVSSEQLSLKGAEQYFSLGIILILIATIGWSLGVFISIKSLSKINPILNSSLQMISGGGILLIISILRNENGIESFANASSSAIQAFFYLLIVGSILGFLVFNWVSSKADSTLVATYNYVNPLVALFLGWLIAGEPLSFNVFLASFLIIASIFLISKK